MSQHPTHDRRAAALEEERRRRVAAQLQRDVIALLQRPEFRRYAAHLVYGKLALKQDPWRANAGETAKQAARSGVAVEILKELHSLDPKGFLLLEQEHVARMADELEIVPHTEERDDAS